VIDERELVERAIRALAPQDPSFEDLMRRRDRKRRNRRIAAGAVGLAIGLGVLLLGSAVLRSAHEPVPVDWPSPPQTASPILREGEVLERPLDRQSLVAVDTATGDRRTLVRCTSYCWIISDFAAAAGGGWVAYDVWTCRAVCYPVEEAEAGLWVVNGDGPPRHIGSSPRLVGSSTWSWSPTSPQLAVWESDGSGSALSLLDPATDERTPIVATTGTISAFAWGPDGRSIAYAVEAADGQPGVVGGDDATGIFIVRSGGEPERVSGRLDISSIAWSPDGRFLALETLNSQSGVAVVAVDGSSDRVLVQGPAFEGPGGPVWSPDGSRIAYLRTPGVPGNYELEFWVVGRDGSGPVRLGRFGNSPDPWAGPVWSPDSDRVAFSGDAIHWVAASADGSTGPGPIERLEVERWQL
jgi:dipeptidyl aminopeptidase/acylaminoacyl peptidase